MRVPEACIVTVGDEIVSGRRMDRNGVRLGRWLEGLGCIVRMRIMVPDDETLIADAVRAALDTSAELIVITGGLGATGDDRTREGVALGVGRPLELDPTALATIEARYRERGRDVPTRARLQAYRPSGSDEIPNPLGPAPGFIVDRGRTLVVALPGVAREIEEMLDRAVLPRVRQRLSGALVMESAVLRVAGLAESEVDQAIRPSLPAGDEGLVPKVTILPWNGEIEILVTVRAEGRDEAGDELSRTLAAIEARLGDHVYGRDQDTLVGVVRDQLLRRGWMLGAAESITGGLLAKRIVDQPGSGVFFAGALVPYADRTKPAVLDLSPELLDRHGVVSAEVARAMAENVRVKLAAEVGVATTGIAGPAGGSQDKPVGLTYIAVAWPDRTVVRRHVFSGDRATIRMMAAVMALEQTRRALLGLAPLGDAADAPEQG